MNQKIVFVMITVVGMNVHLRGQTITLDEKGAPLITVINKISSQAGVDFLYTSSTIKAARPVTLKVTNADLNAVLEKIFALQPLGYVMREKSVLLFPKKGVIANSDTGKARAGPPAGFLLGGFVSDSLEQPLEGATVTLEKTKYHTVTRADGTFRLLGVPAGEYTVVVTHVGFSELTAPVEIAGEEIHLRLVMYSSPSILDQASVIAYGSSTERMSVSAVSLVAGRDIVRQPVTNFLNALGGMVPGLTVTAENGAPGSMSVAQVRGQNTIANMVGFKDILLNINQPLYLLDGVPLASQNMAIQEPGINNSHGANILANAGGLSPLKAINPMDIESISVLKDADATSIFGSQGSNGVILITTKRGKPGSDRLELNVESGVSFASRTVPMMDTRQYLEMRSEALANSGLSPSIAGNDADVLLYDATKSRDFYKEFFGGAGRQTVVNAGLSGGTPYFSYLVNLSGAHETYNFPGGFADDRYTIHTAFTRHSPDKRLAIDLGTDYTFDKNHSTATPAVLNAFTLPPNMPDLKDSYGRFVWGYRGYDFINTPLGNPYAYLDQTAYTAFSSLTSHLTVNFQLSAALRMVVSGGYSRQSDENHAIFPMATQNPVLGAPGYANFGNYFAETLNIEPQLNYSRKVGRGALTLLLGGTYRKNTMKNSGQFVYGYSNDALLNSVAGGISSFSSNAATLYKYDAIFGRLNFIWGGKYILNCTANRNGSSNFGPDRTVGMFGSAGVGWILSEEGFLKNLGWLSFAKVSGNYGTSGSDGVAPYQYQPNWAPVISYRGYQGVNGYYPVNPQNPTYAWALNKKLNLGLEIGVLQNRFILNIAAYRNRSSDQLVEYNQPIQTGFATIITNTPYDVENRGIEFLLTTNNITGKKFQWSSSVNVFRNSNRLIKFPDRTTSPYRFTYFLGESVNSVPLVPYEGVNPATGIFSFKKKDGTVVPVPDTGPAFNGNGGDASILINPDPQWAGGLTNTFAYRNFSLTIIFQFVKQTGRNYLYSIYQSSVAGIPGGPGVNLPAVFADRWRKPGDHAEHERLSEGPYTNVDRVAARAVQALLASTGAYSDASYIRLKTLSFSYSLSPGQASRIHIKGCTFFVKGQNLLLLTPYKIGDPEIQYLFTIPPQRMIAVGLNVVI